MWSHWDSQKVITLSKTNNKRSSTIQLTVSTVNWDLVKVNLGQFNHIIQMITLSVVTLGGFHYNNINRTNVRGSCISLNYFEWFVFVWSVCKIRIPYNLRHLHLKNPDSLTCYISILSSLCKAKPCVRIIRSKCLNSSFFLVGKMHKRR